MDQIGRDDGATTVGSEDVSAITETGSGLAAAQANSFAGGGPDGGFNGGFSRMMQGAHGEVSHRPAARTLRGGVWEWDLASDRISSCGYTEMRPGQYPESPSQTFDEWRGMLHPDDRAAVLEAVQSHLAERTPYAVQYRIRVTGGGYRWRQSNGEAVWDAAGKPVRMRGIYSDIDELVRARQAAEKDSRSKSLFLADLGHELRTPLNGILGMAALLQHNMRDPEQARRIDGIVTSGRAMLSLIEDLVDLSRIEAAAALESAPVDPGPICREAVAILEGSADAKGLALALDVAPDLPPAIADARRLKQVLLNLLGNAVKFTGSGTVTLGCRRAGDAALRFTVDDTGPGLAPEEVEPIFARFARGNRLGPDQPPGAGLGLAICRELVQRMQGRIGAVSRPGGATFWVELPAATPATQAR